MSGVVVRRRDVAETKNWTGPVYFFVFAGLISALFVPAPGRFLAPWIGCMQDLAHVPLFALVTWTLLRLTGGRTMTAALIALSIAVVAEPLQSLVGRSNSLADVARGMCGIAIVVGWSVAGQLATGWRRPAGRLACLAIFASLPLAGAWPVLADAIASWLEFPVLADFTSPWEDRRWTMQGCRMSIEPGLRGEGDGILQCDARDEAHPSITLFPIRRDWSSWSLLQVEFSVEGGPLPMTLSVRDGRKVSPPLRRFDWNDVYQDGRHTVGIDLAELARGSGYVAPVDVGAVQSFHLILEANGVGRTIRLHRIWLE